MLCQIRGCWAKRGLGDGDDKIGHHDDVCSFNLKTRIQTLSGFKRVVCNKKWNNHTGVQMTEEISLNVEEVPRNICYSMNIEPSH